MSTDLSESNVPAVPRRKALAVFGGTAVGMLAARESSAHASPPHAERSQGLVGTWDLTVRFPDGLENPTLIQFSPPGSLVETNALTRSTGLGEWRSRSGRRYEYRFWEQIFGDDGKLSSFVRVEHVVTLARDGKTYDGSGVGYVYDLNWNLVQTVDTGLVARRAPAS